MVKVCLPVAGAAVVLLLMVATAQGIRLDAGSKAALGNGLNKSVEKGVVIKADGAEQSSGEEVEEAISEDKERAGHRMPEIHVDYYGPRGHNARHH
ncbi:hypothetical protein ACQJBY_063039 [Aegilops geniculata]